MPRLRRHFGGLDYIAGIGQLGVLLDFLYQHYLQETGAVIRKRLKDFQKQSLETLSIRRDPA